CSNNCPYKVRRFNFYLYQDFTTEIKKLGRNPEVTVRSRGVMEKCTYCIQRINRARYDAERETRPIRDGEIVTACQQACPTQAIACASFAVPRSAVRKPKPEKRGSGPLPGLAPRPPPSYPPPLSNPTPTPSSGGPPAPGEEKAQG